MPVILCSLKQLFLFTAVILFEVNGSILLWLTFTTTREGEHRGLWALSKSQRMWTSEVGEHQVPHTAVTVLCLADILSQALLPLSCCKSRLCHRPVVAGMATYSPLFIFKL